jgi:WS/DGAT/MGAT family acyltransferase
MLGPRRAFAYASVPLAAVKAVKREFDVTVNDVILAITGSAVRRYLLERGELPEKPLVALIAVSRRDAGDLSVGNAVTTVPVGWATDLDDPVARLRCIHRNAAKSKEFARNYDVDFLAGVGDSLSPLATNLYMRSFAGVASSLGTLANVVVSNVRATPVPLYVGGAKIESMYPLSILGPSQGLNATLVSYMGNVDVGFTVDPQLVPDPWALADAIPQALDELSSASSRSARSAA